ncbi:AMMECR1 domain-containing protein [bacterium]|uniref:AMMECR1 domain-containing protein n=1 Tax=Candidatus Nealsonbacteria bacterium CG_4_9_14_3_um_filter_37_29 TaxID=1974696 RepID=A0A2M7Z2U7_9BACT|nr:AMMECR1 domain-containing protein [bacterium]PJA82617.1 MAG: AMMECR1 domain-containing protein [Candidatus Nealsonbacteria bacterium CG_4_9_14_3_um_filter_37_29]
MHPLVLLAKSAVETFIKEGKIISLLEDLPEEFLKRRAGTFVTIDKENELRGCIGTYLPTRINIAEEVIRNAIAAATEDYRFGSIQKEELPYLSYTVYILSYPEPVKDIKELNPKKFGVIIKTGPFTFPNEKEVVFDGVIPYKTGLLLPDLEGVDTIEKQISIACQKGGIDPESEKIFIYRFTVEKYQ